MRFESVYTELVHPQVLMNGIAEAVKVVESLSAHALHIAEVILLKVDDTGWTFRLKAWENVRDNGEWVFREGRFAIFVPFGDVGELQAEAWTEKRG